MSRASSFGSRIGRGARRMFWPTLFGIVLCGVLFLGVFPTRAYVEKKQEVSTAEAQLAALNESNAQVQARVDALNSDAEIERIAREQYGLVKPGEETYHILPTPQAPVEIPDVWPFDRFHKSLG